jgi:hypothetical protein
MKQTTKQLLFEAWQYCDNEDKSTEFMLQYMQDVANVDLDCVINFIQRNRDKRPTPKK